MRYLLTNSAHSVPNLPFFYLVYRAWSHWRAFSGGNHLQFLLTNNLIRNNPSQVMDNLYAAANSQAIQDNAASNEASQSKESIEKETMVLSKPNAKIIAKALEIPELEMELDRAIWQVETALKSQEALQQEKKKLDIAATEGASKDDTKEKQ
jgi:hypothetical protein